LFFVQLRIAPPGPNLTLSLTVLPLPMYLGEQMAAQAQQ
jgi:hypothetical protein